MPLACENCKDWPRLISMVDSARTASDILPAEEKTLPTPALLKKTHNEVKIMGNCVCCGTLGKIVSRGLIRTCYDRHRAEGRLKEFPLIKKERSSTRKSTSGRKPVAMSGKELLRRHDLPGQGNAININLVITIQDPDDFRHFKAIIARAMNAMEG